MYLSKVLDRIKRVLGRMYPSCPPLFSKVPEEIAEYDGIEGFLTQREAAALFYYAARVKGCGSIVEVGSWKGKSTYCLAKGLRDGKVFAIDPFDASGDPPAAKIYKERKGVEDLLVQFKERMSDLNVIRKIEILHGFSVEFKDKFKEIDLLFIDGDHSINGCKADFEFFAQKIVPGGYILLHDYDSSRNELGPTWVVKNLIADNSTFKHICLVDSLWIGKRL
jgi:predicted O-methyltransferase YrrM